MKTGGRPPSSSCRAPRAPRRPSTGRKALKGEQMPKWVKQVDQTFSAEKAAEVLPSRKY